jgi:hypothetical protein
MRVVDGRHVSPHVAIGTFLDHTACTPHDVFMKSATRTISLVPTRTTVITPAPMLAPLVDVLFQVKTAPDDKSAKIKRALLARSGADRCPACQHALSLDGYAHTRNSFVERETLACDGCNIVYVVREAAFA